MIRSYGPGKFIKLIDGYAYDVTLDGGADEEASLGEGNGWYGLLHLDKAARDHIHQRAHYEEEELTEEESDLLDDSAAIIFFERSDGIVEADWFADMGKAKKAWDQIEADIEENLDDDEDEEVDLDELAAELAAEHHKQGWSGDGSDYDIGVYHGDSEALADALGRAPSREELKDFESAMRDALNEDEEVDLDELAAELADEHRKQGWSGDGSDYNIGAYHGDSEALADALGRKPSREELKDFESDIRAALSDEEGDE